MDKFPEGTVPVAVIAASLLVIGLCYRFILRVFGVVIIPEDSIGIVNKKFVLLGRHKTLPDGQIIALQSEAGNQADLVASKVNLGG